MIAEQTNVYAQEVLSTDAYKRFDQVRLLEIQAYFGFVILMGSNQLPCLYDYWKFDPTYHYSPVADRISQRQFLVSPFHAE